MTNASAARSLRVWIGRPAGRAQALAAALRRRGLRPLRRPAMRIVPPDDVSSLVAYLRDPARFAVSVFVSADAARLVAGKLPPGRDGLPALAIGAKTAAALGGAYRLLAPPPAAEDSRALLALPFLRRPATVAALGGGGEDGKPPAPLLRRVLAARGGEVSPVVCYQRQAAPAEAALSALGDAGGVAAAVAYSAETLRFMLSMTAPNNDWLRRLPVFVIHVGIARQAQRLGFARVIVANDADMAARIAQTLVGEDGKAWHNPLAR